MTDITYKFTPKREQGKEGAAVFTLRELTIQDVVESENALVGLNEKGRATTQTGTAKLVRFQRALVGWENLKRNGEPLAFSEENKLLVPIAYFNELVAEINRRTDLGEADERD